MKINRNTRNIWGILSVGLIIVSYLLVRFVLFDLHGMKDWPNFLAIFSILTLVIASIFKKRIVFIGVIFGYIAGFAAAMIFNSSSLDAGGASSNNAWIIWVVFLLASTGISFLISFRKGKSIK